jgi:sulfate-transporting ATPase/ATP-binding cassette subfamily B protein
MKPLIRLLRGEHPPLAIALVLTVMAAGAELAPYWLLAQAAGAVIAGGPETGTALRSLAGWMVLAIAAKYLLFSAAYYLSHTAAYRILVALRGALARRLLWLPLADLQDTASGRLKQIILQDVERIEQFVAHHLVELAAAIVGPMLAAILLCWADWRLALAALVTLPLAVLAQGLMMRGMDARVADYQNLVGDLNAATVEYVRTMPVMKAFGQDGRSFRRIGEALDRYRRLVVAMIGHAVPGWSAFTVLLGANVSILLPLGLWLHREGSLPLTDLVLGVMLGAGLLRPLFRIARFSQEIREIRTGVARISPLLASAPPAAGTAATPGRSDIDIDGVSFAYGDRLVLDRLDLHLPAGSFTALVGPSGAGKSTVAHLLGGLIEPAAGRIAIGGVPLVDFDDGMRAQAIAVTAQHAFLFRGSLRENLLLARPDADDAALARALEIAQAPTFIADLNAAIGEGGLRLSGGERQRIAIARALLAETPVLVLDEATAFADGPAETRFYQALRAARPDQTVLVIAHRLQAVAGADRIVVLDRGRLVDAAPHDTLLARCPLYRRLWQRQFEGQGWTIGGADAAG